MHIPVLVNELLAYLQPQAEEKFIDATLGEGGQARVFLKHKVNLLGIDRDPELFKKASSRLAKFSNKILIRGNFRFLKDIALNNDFSFVAGIYFDLGASLWHFKKSGRGFSFHYNEPLDMRYNPRGRKLTAAEIINNWSQDRIAKLLRELGEESRSVEIAKAIVNKRKNAPLKTTGDLLEVVTGVKGSPRQGKRIHPATKTFQALRIKVNRELDNLREGLRGAEMLLKKKGRMGVVSFHSLEDRIVKRFFAQNARLKVLTDSPLRAKSKEIEKNPSARSAKLRVAEQTYSHGP